MVKLGSSSLTTDEGAVNDDRLAEISAALHNVRARGAQVVLVSSGAIAAGLVPLGQHRRPRDLPTLQAAASVGQGLLLGHWSRAFAVHDVTVAQVLLTADDVTRRVHYRNARQTLTRLLELGALPVVNENDTVATEEIRFGDNDRLAALVAHLINADLLLLLSDVDGVYDGNPRRGPAQLITDVRGGQDLAAVTTHGGSEVGSGGMASKVAAAGIAAGAGVPVVITAANRLAEVLAGEKIGTLFHPTGDRIASRLLWLAHATTPRGTLTLDPGAVAAVVDRRSSLLAAGVTAVTGSFVVGDPVDLLDPAGVSIGRGLVGFDADELPGLLGRSGRATGQREVVHRDDLVVSATAILEG